MERRLTSLQSIFNPQSRKNRLLCDLEFTIESLVDVPLVHGQFYASVKMNQCGNDFKTPTPLASVKDHCIVWNYLWKGRIYLQIGKDNRLQPCPLNINIKKAAHGRGKDESIGKVSIDMAEMYTNAGLGTAILWHNPQIQQQLLLQQSKMNSTLMINFRLGQAKPLLQTGKASATDVLLAEPSQPIKQFSSTNFNSAKQRQNQKSETTLQSIIALGEEAEEAYLSFATDAKELIDAIFQTIEEEYNNNVRQ